MPTVPACLPVPARHRQLQPLAAAHGCPCDRLAPTSAPDRTPTAPLSRRHGPWRSRHEKPAQGFQAEPHLAVVPPAVRTCPRLPPLLLQLGVEYGKETEDGLQIDQKITHQEMANLIGSTRETISLTLAAFKRKELVQLFGRTVVLTDLDGLAALT